MLLSEENLNSLMKRLQYVFQDKKRLKQALTHRSAAAENNERLEFLGDAVLNCIVATHLFLQHPQASEGELTRMRAKWVCESALAEIASELSLSDYLILGPGEKKGGGAQRASILADALEALIGAIYLESGMSVCQTVVLAWYQTGKSAFKTDTHRKDAKTRLQEYLQAKQLPLASYAVTQVTGDAHHPVFQVCCTIARLEIGVLGQAASRKKAEQAAAEAVLQQLGVDRK